MDTAYVVLVFLGHGIPGFTYIVWGLMRLFNIAVSSVNESWFLKSKKYRDRLEFYTVFVGAVVFVLFEYIFFLRMSEFRTYQNIGHVATTLPFLIYAAMGLAVSVWPRFDLSAGILNLILTLAFCQELFLFHFHARLTHYYGSVEYHYHLLLQFFLVFSVISCILEILWPRDSTVAFAKCISLILQGTWFFQISLILCFPRVLLPLGCQVNMSSHQKILCTEDRLVDEANALANLRFILHVTGVLTGSSLVYGFIAGSNAKRYSTLDDSVPS